jgi:hypothetical protein
MVVWVTAEQPDLPLYAAKDPRVERWYQEDQVLDVVRSDLLGVNRVSEFALNVTGELDDVFDGNQRVVAVFIQRPTCGRSTSHELLAIKKASGIGQVTVPVRGPGGAGSFRYRLAQPALSLG